MLQKIQNMVMIQYVFMYKLKNHMLPDYFSKYLLVNKYLYRCREDLMTKKQVNEYGQGNNLRKFESVQ